jgi:hypothetical protein
MVSRTISVNPRDKIGGGTLEDTLAHEIGGHATYNFERRGLPGEPSGKRNSQAWFESGFYAVEARNYFVVQRYGVETIIGKRGVWIALSAIGFG